MTQSKILNCTILSGYLSPTPGPPRRRAPATPASEEASAKRQKTEKQTLLKLKPLSSVESAEVPEQTPEKKKTQAEKESDEDEVSEEAEKPNEAEKPDHSKAEKSTKPKKVQKKPAMKSEEPSKKPKEAEKPTQAEKPKEAEKPTQAEKPNEAEKPDEAEKPKLKAEKPNETEKPNEAEKPSKAEKPTGKASGDIQWNAELGKACWQKSEGIIVSSTPFVDKDDEVKVSFDGLLWSVPHLVPSDLDPSKPTNPLHKVSKPKVPKAKQATPKPIEDYVYPIIRCKYATQGSKSPLIKVEAREDRHDLHSKWVQKLQLVIKADLSVGKAMNIAKTLADAYVYMNLNPSRLNFRGCRESLLGHNHDWESSALDWQTVNKLGLKHFPKSQLELCFCLACPGLASHMLFFNPLHRSMHTYVHMYIYGHSHMYMVHACANTLPHTHTHTHRDTHDNHIPVWPGCHISIHEC